jgi:hypothetical protein
MRFRSIAGGLAAVMAATLGVPAAASAATGSVPRASYRPNPGHEATPAGPAARAGTAGPAATAGSIPWKRYRTKPWHDAPGKVCAFGVSVTIVRDREQYRTLASYPGGKPKVQEFRGPLFVRYTNTTTHESVAGNLSGYGWFYYRAGGGLDAYVASHIGLTVPVGNRGFPAGEWIVSGQSLVTINNKGAINVVLIHATTENICRALS